MKLKPVLWIVSAVLLFPHIIILVTYISLLLLQDLAPSASAVSYSLLIILFIAVFIVGLIKKSIRENKAFTLFCSVSVAVMVAGLVLLLMDAPEIKNDYSEKDVLNTANGSYQYIDFFNKADVKAFKTANEKLGQGYKGKVDIKAFGEVWSDIIKFRHAVEELDKFDVICDLPENAEMNMEMPFMNFSALRETAKIYRKYFLFELYMGRGREAAEELCRLHRVARKGMNDATVLINKIIFNAIVTHTMDTAVTALLNKNCDEEIISILAEEFTPIDAAELSLKRPMIAEYLFLKNTMQKSISPGTFLESTFISPGNIEKDNRKNSLTSYFVYYAAFKPNKSLAPMKKYYELLIEAQDDFPADFTKPDMYLKAYGKTLPISNMAGWILNTIAMPNFEPYFSRLEATKIKSDLLNFVLQKRLGRVLETKDIYTQKPYEFIEKKGFLLYAGKDGKFETDDDIILGIKPEK